MKVKKQLLLLVALMVLLVGAASATDVSDDTTGTTCMAEETIEETQTATDMNNIATQDNEENDVETDTGSENGVSASQDIRKNIDKVYTKEAIAVTTWDELNQTIADATEDTIITLQENMINEETITFNNGIAITIDGNGKTIDGNQNQVFIINSESTLVLKNITITNAQAARIGYVASVYGGAIYNSGNLSITDSTFTNNQVTATGSATYAYGGAIYNSGNLTITDSIIQDNQATATATGMNAGAYADGGAIYNIGNLYITNSTLQDNHATATAEGLDASSYAEGGAIYSWGNLTITDSTLTNNKGNATTTDARMAYVYGGAIYSWGNLIIMDSTLQDNQATATGEYGDALGGAIYNYENLTITHSTLQDNQATAIATASYGTASADGGAIYSMGENYNITDTTFYKNSPDNFIISETTNKIGLKKSDRYITIVGYSIIVDGIEKANGTSIGDLEAETYTIPNESNSVEIIVNGTDSKTINNRFILKKSNVEVHNYTELVEAIKTAQNEQRSSYVINLLPGNYDATENITWEESKTKNLIINGNGLTLDGNNTYQFIKIASDNNLTLNNVTITNYTSDSGGAIYNSGTLTITDSTLTNNIAEHAGAIYNVGTLCITDSSLNNNIATLYGGAIRNHGTLSITHNTLTDNNALHAGAIWNFGTLSITDSTLINNTATHYAGTIYNSGTITITDSTLANNTANIGGAIHNNLGRLNIIHITLANNTANEKGGAISNIYQEVVTINEYPEYINVINSNFIKNHAGEGGAIYSLGYANLTGNTFSENTADNKETIDLHGYWNGIFNDNQYISTDISLKAIELSVNDNKETFETGEDVTLYFNIELEHPIYYDSDILEKTEINKTLYVNGVENVTTNNTNYSLSNLSPGKYTVNYNTTNGYSNNVTFKMMGYSEITTPDDSYDYYGGVINYVTLNIRDSIEGKGTANIRVKDGDKYQELIICNNVKDGYTFSTETLKEALENLYADELGDSYTINVTYTGEYALPSSTEFMLNIIKQRNTSILYDIINNTEGNVQINITVLDDIYRTPVPDAAIKITGDIQQETTSGVITDTTLCPDDYTITVKYEENDDYKASNITFDFTVEIDKDALINELLAPKKTTITLDPVNDAKYNSNVTITGSLVNEDSIGLYNQVVTITIGDKVAEVTTRGGIFEYNTTIKTVGEQTIAARYEGTDKYMASNTTQTFMVNKRESKVTVNDIAGVTCNDNVTITGMITDIDDNPLGHVNVFVYLNGEQQHVTTYRTGIFKATFTTTTVGEQEVLVIYKGNKNYLSSNATAAFTTSGMKLVMFTVKSVTYRDTYTIQGKLTDYEGKVVTGAEVQLTVNGETITLTTDKNGKYTYKAQALKTGNFTVTAKCNDEATGTQLTATKTLTVTKHVTKIVVDEIPDTTVGTPTTITGKLTDENGTIYKNCNIYVKINGVQQHVKTDSKGIFTCTYTPTSAGTQNLTVTYKGNSNYLGDKVTKSFTVN